MENAEKRYRGEVEATGKKLRIVFEPEVRRAGCMERARLVANDESVFFYGPRRTIPGKTT